MILDKIYNMDCVRGMSEYIDAEAVDLIIADPPYFKVVGEKWDYQWRTEEDYIEWSGQWFEQVSRVLRKGGTFYLFGYFRMLSLLLPLLERHNLKLKQQIIISKGLQAVSGRATKNYKIFPNTTESILMLYNDPKPFVKELLKSRQKELGYSSKYINEKLGVKSNGGGMWSIYTGKNVCEQLPTVELWEKLQAVLGFNYPYQKLAPTFNPQLGITDVWDDINFYKMENRIHPTQKPLALIDRLILASSNSGDVVLDPFMGSGTTACSAANNGRRYIGFECDKEYYDKAIDRILVNYSLL